MSDPRDLPAAAPLARRPRRKRKMTAVGDLPAGAAPKKKKKRVAGSGPARKQADRPAPKKK